MLRLLLTLLFCIHFIELVLTINKIYPLKPLKKEFSNEWFVIC